MANTCRAKGCRDNVLAHQIMCKYHWSLVTKHTRMRVCQLFKSAPGSQAHHEAINDAIKEVEEYLRYKNNKWRPLNAV
jgi:hypothetical protein